MCGYQEEGTTTTPLDMVARNDMDRYPPVAGLIGPVPKPGYHAAYGKQAVRDKLIGHKEDITTQGGDLPDIRGWRWADV